MIKTGDLRQEKCWDLYVDPKSTTFGNAKRSAMAAGFAEEYSNQITTVVWFMERVDDLRRQQMLKKAERNLDKALDMNLADEKLGDRVLKATLFVAERVGKRYYSSRTEQSGPDGGPIQVEGITVTFVSPEDEPKPENPV